MADTTDINELFSQGQKSLEASKSTSNGPIDTAVSLKERGYLPEMVTGGAATATTGYAIGKYLQNLKDVREAIAAEEEAVRKLRTPATKGGRQPFAKEGFTLSGARDVKATMPQKGGGVDYTRLSNVEAIGGPEGTGLGVLKGKEKATAAKMTAEQMIKWLRQESNLGVTATTPRIQIKGFQEGEAGRKTVVVSPENVRTGKLPTTAIPSGELPPPEAGWIPKTGQYLAEKGTQFGNYLGSKVPTWVPAAAEKVSPYVGPAVATAGIAAYANEMRKSGPVETVLSYGVPFTRFTGIGPVVELGKGSDLESRGRWMYPADGGEPKFVPNQ